MQNKEKIEEILESLYANRILKPISLNEIPCKKYLVYILTINNKPIVVGHGKKNRAKIIFDDKNQITSNHLKALFVRLYHLFSENAQFCQYLIECKDKEEAKKIEKKLHKRIGGNTRDLPQEILDKLFNGFREDSIEYMIFKIALCSSFDGISDIKKWRREKILKGLVWKNIKDRMKL